MPTVTIVSQVIGFISFAITLLTLLGVYRDLISTMRNAPHEIPIMLGNLRQELEAERTALGRRLYQGDPFHVFPRKVKTDRGWKKAHQAQVIRLLNSTVSELWERFRALERPFLIRNPNRAEAVRRGDYWGDDDLAEKPPAGGSGVKNRDGKIKNAMGMEEAAVGVGQQSYYQTGMTHRFVWWQSKSDVISLMDQMQRVQVRRIEGDVFETDELVKRCLRILARENGESGKSDSGGRDGSGSGSGSGSDRGKRGVRKRRNGKVRSSSRAESVRATSHVRDRIVPSAAAYRDSSEVEVVRVRDGDVDRRDRERDRPQPRPSAAELASNTGRRRDSRAGYDYEVVRPGRMYVDVVGDDSRPRPSARGQGTGYPERDRNRDTSGDRGQDRRGKRDRDRRRYENDD